MAAALFYLGMMFIALSDSFSANGASAPAFPSWNAAAARMWTVLAGNGTDIWTIIGGLAAIIMIPITLFISTVLTGGSHASTRWMILARETALNLLYWTSLLVPVVTWLCIPLILHPQTFLVGLPALLGTGYLGGVLSGLSRSERDLIQAQKENSRHLTRLKKAEKKLRKQAKLYLFKPSGSSVYKLSNSGKLRLTLLWSTVIAVVFILSMTFVVVGLNLLHQSVSQALITTLLLIGLLLLNACLGGLLVWKRGTKLDKRNTSAIFTFVLINLLLFLTAVSILLNQGVNARTLWIAVAMCGLPIAAFFLTVGFGAKWFVYYRWQSMQRRVVACKRDNARTAALAAAFREESEDCAS